MDALKIPTDPNSPVLFLGMPAVRFVMVAVVAGLFHAAVAWGLCVLVLGFGLGTDFDGTGREFSRFLSVVQRGWNFGYFLFRPLTHEQEIGGTYPVVIPAWSAASGLFVGWLDAARRKRTGRIRATVPAE